MRFAIAAVVVAASVFFSSSLVYAGNSALGFPLGEKSRLHTNLTMGVGYDTNVRRRETGNEQAGTKARLTPSLAISVPSSVIRMGLNGGINIDQFLDGVSPCGSKGNDGESGTTCLGGYFGILAQSGTKKSILGFNLSGGMLFSPTELFAPPRPSVGASTSNETAGLTNLGAEELRHQLKHYVVSPSFVFRPGGGALAFRLGYGGYYTSYEDMGWEGRHSGTFEAKLRFLPRTAVVLNADMSMWSAENEGAVAGTTKYSATPFNVTLGLRGQVTERIQTNLKLGYGDAMNEATAGQQQSVIGGVFVRYLFARSISLNFGYQRAIQNVIRIGSYVGDVLNLGGTVMIVRRLQISLASSYTFRTFSDGSMAQVPVIGLRAGYKFFRFLDASLSYQFLNQAVTVNETTVQLDETEQSLSEYRWQIIMFGVGLQY